MTPEQLGALEAVAVWMEHQAAAATAIALLDRDPHERLRAGARADAHLSASLRLRGVIVGLS